MLLKCVSVSITKGQYFGSECSFFNAPLPIHCSFAMRQKKKRHRTYTKKKKQAKWNRPNAGHKKECENGSKRSLLNTHQLM